MNSIDYKSNLCSPRPSIVVVQNPEGIKGLSNCFVYVVSLNSTYFISSSHEITILFSGPVYADNYAASVNPLGLRGQTVYDFANNKAYVYDMAGNYRVLNLTEEQA